MIISTDCGLSSNSPPTGRISPTDLAEEPNRVDLEPDGHGWTSAPEWCRLVHEAMSDMGRAKAGSSKPVLIADTVRASVSFPRNIHETLEKIAREKKVSLAWVVREATERYIADRWPLLVVPKGD